MIRRLFVRVAEAEKHLLGEGPAKELEPHRELVSREPRRNRERRESDGGTQSPVAAQAVVVFGFRIRLGSGAMSVGWWSNVA